MYSFFRDRLIIPIRDQLGNIIGFGARALQEGQEPKYLNSPESIIYDKSKILYGLDHLKKGVKDHQRIIIVEGYFDVIALQRVGLDIGVATCGTSLTAQHMEILKRYHEHIYLLFDNDKAGATATLRALSIAYEQGVYPQVINLKQSATPVKDIDELLSQDDDPHTHIQDLITQAHDGFRWALHYYLQHHTLHNPVERQKILHGVFDLVYATKQMSTQNLFLEQVAQELGIDYTLILSQYRQYAKTEKKLFRHRHEQPTQTSQVSEQRHSQKELLLGALLRNNFWQTLQLDPLWIEHLQQFVQLVQYQGVAQESEYDERQLWREQELAMHDSASRTHIAKQVLLPYFHSLQKTALKIVDQESKQELLRIIQALR